MTDHWSLIGGLFWLAALFTAVSLPASQEKDSRILWALLWPLYWMWRGIHRFQHRNDHKNGRIDK